MATNSGSSEEPFETNDEICQKLIDEFVQKTDSDEILAQFFLQERNWNLRLSLNDFFEQSSRQSPKQNKRSSDVIEVSSGDESEGDVVIDSYEDDCHVVMDHTSNKARRLSANTSLADSSPEPPVKSDIKQFRFITWNIDGIDEKNLRIRTEAVCKYIRDENALIVFLQEVVSQSEKILRESLPDYHLFSGDNNTVNYYTITAIHKSYVKLESNEIIPFPNTSMGRNLLKTEVKIGGLSVCLLNTHLESTKDFSDERVSQLNQIFDCITNTPNNVSVIMAGDLNLRDHEASKSKGFPKNMYDVWLKTGGRKELQYTWDLMRNDNLQIHTGSRFKPRMRFDRVFVRPAIGSKFEAKHFGLIGLERLKPHVCFPSDHWGLRVHFTLA